jgi:hypothetical protein
MINAMSNCSGVIKKCILTKEINEQGVYAFEFLCNGVKTKVLVDDHLLVKNMFPAFASSKKGKQAWMGLFEKAYAKCLGSFSRLEGINYIHDTMRDLTGAPSFEYKNAKE